MNKRENHPRGVLMMASLNYQMTGNNWELNAQLRFFKFLLVLY